MKENGKGKKDLETITTESEPLINKIAERSSDFMIVGLTGRSGTNVGALAKYLCGDSLKSSPIKVKNLSGYDASELRDLDIADKYLRENWNPFVVITALSVMVSFLLDVDPAKWKDATFQLDDETSIAVFGKLEEAFACQEPDFRRAVVENLVAVDRAIIGRCDETWDQNDAETFMTKRVEVFLEGVSTLRSLQSAWLAVSERLGKGDYESFDSVVITMGVLPALGERLEGLLAGHDTSSLLFQRIGNNIRAYGTACPDKGSKIAGDIFGFSERIDKFCRTLRHYGWAVDATRERDHAEGHPRSTPAFIVIDSFKNIFEAFYLKQKYPTFYLVAVSGDNSEEGSRRTLRRRGEELDFVDFGEDLSASKNMFKKFAKGVSGREADGPCEEDTAVRGELASLSAGMSGAQRKYCQNVWKHDELRKRCYLGDLAPFILQDVMTCIENADVFLTRDLSIKDIERDTRLVCSLMRFMTLALHPGLLKPTKMERCMQIAMTAKLNSGCLSRQVGAVVANADYQILSLGWNDVPCASESCARRSLFDIASCADRDAYSEFELSNPVFRDFISTVHGKMMAGNAEGVLRGLPASYCFKDAYQCLIGERDQIHTRSLHGEEKALAACGNEKAKGAYLFTTSSPCELCAKKAKEAQIKKIYYIEQYPGISHDHVIDDGPYHQRPEYEFFTGIVGAGYTNLYTPLIPYKDELEAIGISPRLLCK